MKKKESEFGMGCVYCLVLFTKHYSRLHSELEHAKEMRKKHGDYWSDNHAVHMWFNAASDHLYDLQIPQYWKKKKLGKLLKELQDKSIDIGHGLGLMQDYTTPKEAEKIIDLVDEIAILIDKELGVKSVKAQFG